MKRVWIPKPDASYGKKHLGKLRLLIILEPEIKGISWSMSLLNQHVGLTLAVWSLSFAQTNDFFGTWNITWNIWDAFSQGTLTMFLEIIDLL